VAFIPGFEGEDNEVADFTSMISAEIVAAGALRGLPSSCALAARSPL
jgi:hypothetical protein